MNFQPKALKEICNLGFEAFKIPLILFISVFSFSACQTTNEKSNIALKEQLNHFIGKDVAYIEEHLNLDQIGIKLNPNPIISSQQAIYTFNRKVSIPIPSGHATLDSRGVMIPTQISSVSDRYSNTLTCNIIFNLEHQIAQSVLLQGRAC